MLLGWARLVGTGCTMVPMEPGSHHGLRPLLRHLRGGGWVCLFPEGGIGTGRQYPGAEWLSERTGAPLHRLHIRATGIGKLRLPWRITAV